MQGAQAFDEMGFDGETPRDAYDRIKSGQTGDTGTISEGAATFAVADTAKKLGALHVHMGKLQGGRMQVGDEVTLTIDVARRTATRANHSATHLLH